MRPGRARLSSIANAGRLGGEAGGCSRLTACTMGRDTQGEACFRMAIASKPPGAADRRKPRPAPV